MTGRQSEDPSTVDQTYCSAMRDDIGVLWQAVWNAMPRATAGKNMEGVHKVRVASRRLRAAMDVSTDCFPESWYRPLHKTAKRITRSLGDVRDRDVLLAALGNSDDDAGDDERRAEKFLIANIRRERKQARKRMIRFVEKLDDKGVRKETKRRFPKPTKALTGKKHRSSTEDASANPASGSPGSVADASIKSSAGQILAGRIRDLFGHAAIIQESEAVDELHRARIAAKKLRYTLDLFPSLLREEDDILLDHIKSLQEELGTVHDHDVRIAMMTDTLAALPDGRKPKVRAGLATLLDCERRERESAHHAVVEHWRTLESGHVEQSLMAICDRR